MVLFVCGIIIMGVVFSLLKFPLIMSIPITTVLLFSMYYQIMVWVKQTNMMALGMQIEDRMLNEFGYQTLKRGYTLKASIVSIDPKDPNSDTKYKFETNMPKWKKKYVKTITVIIIILSPAWCFREYEGEDDILE
ncbi:hypothetical protein KAU43_07660 [candidate division WOR-3 bacterium]|nr:hypothetical protein [candidate division WOR-3 bacterium]